MKIEELLKCFQESNQLKQTHNDLLRQILEVLQKRGLDDVITYDQLKDKFNMSSRTYYREKNEGLKAYPFAGQDVLFTAEVRDFITAKGDKKRNKGRNKKTD